jgi:protein-S-isoprenylcysteine O-methyltransferase Ste14
VIDNKHGSGSPRNVLDVRVTGLCLASVVTVSTDWRSRNSNFLGPDWLNRVSSRVLSDIRRLRWSRGACYRLSGTRVAVSTSPAQSGSRQWPCLNGAGRLALMALGALLSVVAQVEMGSAWRIGVDWTEATPLVTTGLFRWMRNPIFAAMLTIFLGLVLVVSNLLACFAIIAMVAGIEIQVRAVEEPHLMRVYGEQYLAYAGRVGRFVPGLGRMK